MYPNCSEIKSLGCFWIDCGVPKLSLIKKDKIFPDAHIFDIMKRKVINETGLRSELSLRFDC